MNRIVVYVLVVLFGYMTAEPALAQSWPESYPIGGTDVDPHAFDRGPGGYLSLVKLGLLIGIYLLWVKTTDWVNKDCQSLRQPYSVWNTAVFFPFLVGLFAALTIPIFPAGFGLLFLAYAVPLGIYIAKRNTLVDPHLRVLTPAHIRYIVSRQAREVGVNLREEKAAAHEKGAPVKFEAAGKSDKEVQSNQILARQSSGFVPAKDLVAEVIGQRADKCMLDFTSDSVSVRFQIDGVWHESESLDRESGDGILEVYKRLADLKVEERQKRQSGRFLSEYKGAKYNSTLLSQGTKTGERVVLQLVRPSDSFKSLDDLGMRDKMQEQLKEVMSKDEGLVIFSSLPANGLSATSTQAMKLVDRYLRDFVALQDINSPEALAENIELMTFDKAKGEEPAKILNSILRKEPAGVVINELPDLPTAELVCQHAVDGKFFVTTIRAKEAVEALLRVLLMKVPAKAFAPAVQAVVNQRLIRKLCETCKEEYEPSPALLQKLGIPAGRVEKLYKPAEPGEKDKVCPDCNGIGYVGRTAIFELLVVNDHIRDALLKQPKLDVLRAVAKKTGNRNLQQEGIVLVVKGVTSLAELSRVLKQ